ncbi:hypothetical protein [Limnochorda pilosa]|uniref:Uncharacterized protein n=1 Tax=Limnochorda pilosa TaxID=1555112 RepID=A0A0K2SR51_LIMPI|nr:hypothetical protein [Limnochorda pilosa]BAS29299.1 hypothetical protein LIP_3487 [Limnochorda pilosa]
MVAPWGPLMQDVARIHVEELLEQARRDRVTRALRQGRSALPPQRPSLIHRLRRWVEHRAARMNVRRPVL